ncbi:MAG: biopolymer transporter ExbD [Pirellulales bacterium]
MAVKLQKGEVLSALSLTPLIDVVFLLLIFFLVASRFEEEERSLKVSLPAASEAQPLTSPIQPTIVNIGKDGMYVVQSKVLTTEQLEAVLVDVGNKNPSRAKVTIRADRDVRWQAVVAVMNMCNKAGIADYDVATEN